MDLTQFGIFFSAAFLVSIISGIAGFGGGILMILAVSQFYDLKLTIALSVLFFLGNNFQKYYYNRAYVDWRFCKLVLSVCLPACALGLWVFYEIDIWFIRYLMAGLCFYLVLSHFFHFVPKIQKPSDPTILVWSGFMGFLTGIANAMPIKVMLLKSQHFKKQQFVGTGAFLSMIIDCLKVPSYAIMGFYHWQYWEVVLAMIIGSLVGNIIAKQCLDRISVQLFEFLVMLMLFLGGIKFLWQ